MIISSVIRFDYFAVILSLYSLFDLSLPFCHFGIELTMVNLSHLIHLVSKNCLSVSISETVFWSANNPGIKKKNQTTLISMACEVEAYAGGSCSADTDEEPTGAN